MLLALYPDHDRWATRERQHRLSQVTAERRLWAVAAAKLDGISVNQWLLNDIDRMIDRDLAGIRDDRRISGYVYIAGPIGCDIIKIGQSRRPHKRLPSVQVKGSRPLTGLFYMQATLYLKAIEQETHCLLQDHRVEGEYFRVTPEAAAEAADLAGEIYSQQHPGSGVATKGNSSRY